MANCPARRSKLTDNEYSILDDTDLVFIDPVSTGYSRPVEGEKAREFHGFKKDIESVGDFIRLYTTRYTRWLSPKFLIGESYGTTRAAGLSGYLQERHGLYLNGIMLISAVLGFPDAGILSRQRTALRPLPAHLRRDSLVSPQAAHPPPAAEVAEGSGGVCAQ